MEHGVDDTAQVTDTDEAVLDRLWAETAPAKLPAYAPYTADPICVRCKVARAEHAHHWAPRSIFPDWSWDLFVELCEPCHVEWHTRMREHGLKWPHETQR